MRLQINMYLHRIKEKCVNQKLTIVYNTTVTILHYIINIIYYITVKQNYNTQTVKHKLSIMHWSNNDNSVAYKNINAFTWLIHI